MLALSHPFASRGPLERPLPGPVQGRPGLDVVSGNVPDPFDPGLERYGPGLQQNDRPGGGRRHAKPDRIPRPPYPRRLPVGRHPELERIPPLPAVLHQHLRRPVRNDLQRKAAQRRGGPDPYRIRPGRIQVYRSRERLRDRSLQAPHRIRHVEPAIDIRVEADVHRFHHERHARLHLAVERQRLRLLESGHADGHFPAAFEQKPFPAPFSSLSRLFTGNPFQRSSAVPTSSPGPCANRPRPRSRPSRRGPRARAPPRPRKFRKTKAARQEASKG